MKIERIGIALLSTAIAFSVPMTSIAGSWQPIVNQPYNSFDNPDNPDYSFPAAGIPLLMTDGSLFVLNYSSPNKGEAWKLTPDISGNYVNGTWTQLASLPIIDGEQYSPLYMAEAVLADGRIVIVGGEYDGPDYSFTYTNKGAIYDPQSNTWEVLMGPDFFTSVPLYSAYNFLLTWQPTLGDAASVVLEDGRFMVGNPLSSQAAILDPTTLQWQEVGTSTKQRTFIEGGLTLLRSGNIFHKTTFAEDLVTDFFPTASYPETGLTEIFDVTSLTWSEATPAPIDLIDPLFLEQGPSILRADGTVIVFSGSYGNSAIYDSYNNTWTVGPTFPSVLVPSHEPAKLEVSDPIVFDTQNVNAASFGPQSFQVSGSIVRSSPKLAGPVAGNANVAGAIALVKRGDYSFVTKVRNLQNAGAIGVIVYNNVDDGTPAPMGGSASDITIPSIGISYADGQRLLDNLNGSSDTTGLTGTISYVAIEEYAPLAATDAAAVLLPNGNVLVVAAPSRNSEGDQFLDGIHIFEVTKDNQLLEQPTVLDAENMPAYALNAVPLPTGQVFASDTLYGNAQIYTPDDQSFNEDWRPVIDQHPNIVKPGQTYEIKGFLFNGMSQAQSVDDEMMAATNYPLVRLTFPNGHVFYCRTHDHSFMGVAQPNELVQTSFDVPTEWAGYPMEYGDAQLEVIANGIPSIPVTVSVQQQ